MIVLLILLVLLTLVGVGLLAAMFVRDEPLLGVAGLTALTVNGMAGSVYGMLGSL